MYIIVNYKRYFIVWLYFLLHKNIFLDEIDNKNIWDIYRIFCECGLLHWEKACS